MDASRKLLSVLAAAVLLTAAPPMPSAVAEPGVEPASAAALPDGPAQAWLLADLDSGRILASRNPYAQHAPASTIKLLLAMVVLDHLHPNAAARANATHSRVECSCLGLVPGQAYTTRQLLDGLLLVSGNDAANMLADMLGGYRAAVQAMNIKAHRLGARRTRASSPSGLDGPGWESTTTPHDLALLFRAALAYPVIAQILRQPKALIPGRGRYKEIVNQNELLQRYPGHLGGKTGYTKLARHTYVGAAQRGARRLVVVQMYGTGDLFGQAIGLFDWGFAQGS